MYILNKTEFYRALSAQGYETIANLSRELGIHRNTVHHYLQGAPILPHALLQILSALNLPLELAAIKEATDDSSLTVITPLIETLYREYPEAAFFLFGSRAENRARKYSDFDIGVFKSSGIEHRDYRKMRLLKEDYEDDSPYSFDLVNLSAADDSFLENLKKVKFLAGSLAERQKFEQKIGVIN